MYKLYEYAVRFKFRIFPKISKYIDLHFPPKYLINACVVRLMVEKRTVCVIFHFQTCQIAAKLISIVLLHFELKNRIEQIHFNT